MTRPSVARWIHGQDLVQAMELCQQVPVEAVMAAARIQEFLPAPPGSLQPSPSEPQGSVMAWPSDGPMQAVCWSGANLIPVIPSSLDAADQQQAARAFAGLALQQGRRCSSITGSHQGVMDLWEGLRGSWPSPRDVRPHQPSMVITQDSAIRPDALVEVTQADRIDDLLPACIAMFTAEVGYSPVASNPAAYRQRVLGIMREGKSFARWSQGPSPDTRHSPDARASRNAHASPSAQPGSDFAVDFKAELGAVALGVAQVQGVWVKPSMRGLGLAQHGMAAVVAATRASIAPTVSLYVNSYNSAAIDVYRKVGFQQAGTFATVHFS